MTDRIRNVRIIDQDRDVKDDTRVHLPGPWIADLITMCGYVGMRSQETDERVTCEACIMVLDHARTIARSARRLLPKPPPPRRYSAEDDEDADEL